MLSIRLEKLNNDDKFDGVNVYNKVVYLSKKGHVYIAYSWYKSLEKYYGYIHLLVYVLR